jgi:DNA replicative helicase MCM subunit Mcm2 (Cdc46/Mcm family)
MKCPFCGDGKISYSFTDSEGTTWAKKVYQCNHCGAEVRTERATLEIYEPKYCVGCGAIIDVVSKSNLCENCQKGENQMKIVEKATAIDSVEWVIIESALEEMRKNKRVRYELLVKVQALRDVVITYKEHKVL